MPRSSPWVDALDLHVVGIAIAPLVLCAIVPVPWLPWLVAVVPLGRLLTRTRDLRLAGRPPLPHLAVNGVFLGLAAATGFALSPT